MPPIPNPFEKNNLEPFRNIDGTLTITPRTPGNDYIQPASIAPGAPTEFRNPPPTAIVHNPELEAQIAAADAYFQSNEGRTLLDFIADANDVAERALPGGVGGPPERRNKNTTAATPTAAATPANNNEPRPGPSGEPSAKRPRIDLSPGGRTISTSSIQSNPNFDNPIEQADNMSQSTLPGSAMETEDPNNPAAAAGGGSRAGSLASHMGATPPASIPRPPGFTSRSAPLVFEHRSWPLGYGVATVNIGHPDSTAAASMRLLTTSFQELPIDKPFFYMTPAEYAAVNKPGWRAVSCEVKVIMFNVRVAFETNATTSGLATLNQNKFCAAAIGLNKEPSLRTTNRTFTFGQANEPMIPTSTAVPNYAALDTVMWGVSQRQVAFNSTVPCALTDVPYIIPNYAVMWNRGYDTDLATNVGTGWYEIASKFKWQEATQFSNKVIADYKYDFDFAPLGPDHSFCEFLSGTQANVNADSINWFDSSNKHVYKSKLQNVSNQTGKNPTENRELIFNKTTAPVADQLPKRQEFQTKAATWTRYTPFEKGHSFKKFDDPMSSVVQPSLHVAIKAVPRLSAPQASLVADSFTDVQAMYCVYTKLVCEQVEPYFASHLTTAHVDVNHMHVGIPGASAIENYPVRCGHVPMSVDVPPP